MTKKQKFYTWLIAQAGRNDPIGDLAGDVKHDPTFPKNTESAKVLGAHLKSQNACDGALKALLEAKREFGS